MSVETWMEARANDGYCVECGERDCQIDHEGDNESDTLELYGEK